VIDRAGRFVAPSAEAAGGSVFEALPPEQHELLREALTRVFETGAPLRYELPRTLLDGKLQWIDHRIVPVPAKGEMTTALMISADVTQRHLTEQSLRKRELQLAEAQALTHIGNWEWDLAADRISRSA